MSKTFVKDAREVVKPGEIAALSLSPTAEIDDVELS
jgi:hypothetical protein